MSKLIRRLAMLALVSGVVLVGWAEDKAPLPPDLARISPKAAVMISLRPMDLWNSSLSKIMRAKLGKDVDFLQQSFVEAFGLPANQIERLTLVLAGIGGSGEPLRYVQGTAPVDKGILPKLVKGGKTQKYSGKEYFANDRQAAVVLGPKSFVVGPVGEVQSMLDVDATRAEGNLTPALRLASGKHALVVGLNPSVMDRLEEELPPQMEPFKPLIKANLASLTVDLGDKVQTKLEVTFPNTETAKQGAKALEAARRVLEDLLEEGSKQLGKQEEMTVLAELMKTVQQEVRSAKLKTEGKTTGTRLEVKLQEKMIGGVFVQAAQKVREAATRAQSQNNLKQIGLAMHIYHDKHNHFPPQATYDRDGKPLLSWRVLLLPYLEQNELYKQFKLNEPWDSPHNKKLLAKMPQVYQHPRTKPKHPQGTFYQVYFGKRAAFEGKRGLNLTDFTDGTSNTLLAVEAAKDVPWTKPEDIAFDDAQDAPKLGEHWDQGIQALFADGSVRFLRNTLDKEVLKALITRSGGEVLPACR